MKKKCHVHPFTNMHLVVLIIFSLLITSSFEVFALDYNSYNFTFYDQWQPVWDSMLPKQTNSSGTSVYKVSDTSFAIQTGADIKIVNVPDYMINRYLDPCCPTRLETLSINEHGAVAGLYFFPPGDPIGCSSFLWENDVFTDVLFHTPIVSGSSVSYVSDAHAVGLNNNNVVIGTYDNVGTPKAFVWASDNDWIRLAFTSEEADPFDTQIYGINDNNDIVGMARQGGPNQYFYGRYAVPEPSTLIILVLGLIWTAGLRKSLGK